MDMTGMSKATMTAIVSAIMLITLAPNAEGYFGGRTDDGGRCPRCGKYTMRGATHLCKPKKKSRGVSIQRGGSTDFDGGDEKKPEEKPKNIAIPAILKSLRNTLSEKVISTEARLWTDDKGREIDASWTHITQDKASVYLKSANSGKTRCVKVSSLCAADKKRVNDYVAAEEAKNKVWHRGIYVDEKEVEAFEKLETVKDMIREKDNFASEIDCVKVFQTLGREFLCWAYADGKQGRKLVKFIPSQQKFLADDEKVTARFFWCGTYKYINRAQDDPTVNCLTDNPEFSIKYLLAQMNETAASDSGGNSSGNDSDSGSLSFFASGSGFFITEDGYLITNHHVIEGGREFAILTDNGKVKAKLIRSDPRTDLALLKVEGMKVTPFKFGSKRKEGVGTTIMTMGFPLIALQGFDPKVTRGIISCENGYQGDMQQYQIDASIQKGNSGGPLFNEHGCVVGVIVAMLSGNDVQNVNYAIKKTHLLAFIENCPECSKGIVECDDCKAERKPLDEVIASVRNSCVLVLNYQ